MESGAEEDAGPREPRRAGFMDDLVEWMRADDPGRDAVFGGPGGCGKTTAVRVALERAGRDASWASEHVVDESGRAHRPPCSRAASKPGPGRHVLVVVVISRAARMRELTESRRHLQLRWSWGPDAESLSPPWWRPDPDQLRACAWDVRSAFASARAFGPDLWFAARGPSHARPLSADGEDPGGRISAQDRVSDSCAAWTAGRPDAWTRTCIRIDDSEATCGVVPGSIFESATLPEVLEACSAVASARDATRRDPFASGSVHGANAVPYGKAAYGVEGPCPSRRVEWTVALAARALVAADGVARRASRDALPPHGPSREWSRACSDAQRRASAEKVCAEAYGVALDAGSWSRLACLGALIVRGCSVGKDARARFLRAFVDLDPAPGEVGSLVVPVGGVARIRRSTASLVVGIGRHQGEAWVDDGSPSRDEIVSALNRSLSARVSDACRKMRTHAKAEASDHLQP